MNTKKQRVGHLFGPLKRYSNFPTHYFSFIGSLLHASLLCLLRLCPLLLWCSILSPLFSESATVMAEN